MRVQEILQGARACPEIAGKTTNERCGRGARLQNGSDGVLLRPDWHVQDQTLAQSARFWNAGEGAVADGVGMVKRLGGTMRES